MKSDRMSKIFLVSAIFPIVLFFLAGCGPQYFRPCKQYAIIYTGSGRSERMCIEYYPPSPGDPDYKGPVENAEDADYTKCRALVDRALPVAAYVNNGDGTVSDKVNGLMWQQGDTQNSSPRDQRAAVDYCAALDLAGHTDWRLPTVTELKSLLVVGIPAPGPTINTTYFPQCLSGSYWWDSTYPCTGNAWDVIFENGDWYAYTKMDRKYVRCVRGGP
jgi:hypothetical protein